MDDVWLSKLATFGRHAYCMMVCLSQAWTLLHPICRRNIDIFIFFQLRSTQDKEMLFQTVLGSVMSKKEVWKLNDTLEKYTALIADFSNGEVEVYKWKVPLIK